MAKKVHDDHTTPSIATKRPQQKKQDKKESKVRLAIEQVETSMAKAQRKMEKFKGRVEAHTSQLHELEAKLASMRETSKETGKKATAHGPDHQQRQAEPQEVTAHGDEMSMNSPNEENHSNTSLEESQTASDPSVQQAEAIPEAAQIDEPAVESRTNKRSPMNDVKGIPPEVKTNLESEGITTTQQFLENTRTQQQRRQLANKVGTTPVAIKEWANCADLMRLRGVGGAFSTLLNEAGVHSCRELQQCEPEQLFAKLETISTDQKIGHHIPTLAQVTEWITEAKSLAATSPE